MFSSPGFQDAGGSSTYVNICEGQGGFWVLHGLNMTLIHQQYNLFWLMVDHWHLRKCSTTDSYCKTFAFLTWDYLRVLIKTQKATSWYFASFICSFAKLFSKSFGPLLKPKSYIRRRMPFFNSKRKNLSWKNRNETYLYWPYTIVINQLLMIIITGFFYENRNVGSWPALQTGSTWVRKTKSFRDVRLLLVF